MMTLAGCKTTSVQIVDSFCTGKYYPLTLANKDFQCIIEIRKNESHKETIDSILKYITINEKEFKQCLVSAKDQPKD